MKLYYKDFLFAIGETNGSIRERLGMENEEKAGEKEYKEGARLLRAFILSKLLERGRKLFRPFIPNFERCLAKNKKDGR